MRERKVEKRLVEEVKKIGGKSYKISSPGNAGFPDRMCVFPGGKVFFVETKRPKNELVSARQKHQISILKKLGCDVRIIKNYNEISEFVCEVMTNEV